MPKENEKSSKPKESKIKAKSEEQVQKSHDHECSCSCGSDDECQDDCGDECDCSSDESECGCGHSHENIEFSKGPVKSGEYVQIEYTGTLEDGTVFDSSEKHGAPLQFQVGSGQIIKGFDEAVIGMNVGDSKTITLSPADAYGEPNPDMIRPIPKDQFPQGKDFQPGMIMMVGLPNGMQLPVKIVSVEAETITLDLNHPLAGKTLTFKIKMV